MVLSGNKAVHACIALGLILSSGCGWLNKKRETNNSDGPTESKLKLTGNWQADCKQENFLGMSYAKTEYIFLPDNSFTKTVFNCSDNQCSTRVTHLVIDGSYKTGGDVSGQQGVKEIDSIPQKLTMTPDTDEKALEFNKTNFCGFSNWKAGQLKDITGKTCGFSTFTPGKTVLDIFKIEEDGALHFGSKGIFFALTGPADKRPAELDNETIFHLK